MIRSTKHMTACAAALVTLLVSMMLPFTSRASEEYTPLPKEGKEVWIGKDMYFQYSFASRPSLGTVILKVEVYDRDGKRNTSLRVTGDSGMPSMAGHHDTGDVAFKQNQKGDYLLPVNVVMPGDWEVRLTFRKGDDIIFRGSISFHV